MIEKVYVSVTVFLSTHFKRNEKDYGRRPNLFRTL